ncbi:zeta toxin family protein [Cyanobium sp. Morenito 9A2]|uniref:zeta toxin family protein n=1 Tax=Cyanobium sp. Morenito 9A2 TaxID=2823718 RepID=UPI0020CD608D|nr:zeta toxin family protein [Cyanobium sp. Morenito 9A2]
MRIVIVAGPNGAGKTTFAREFLPKDAGLSTFINADLIAAGLSPFAPERSARRAARLMLEEIEHCVATKQSFALETTLSGLAYAHRIDHWRQAGYRVKLIFLQLANAEEAIERVRLRISQGGHAIPEDVIRRRFRAGWRIESRSTARGSTAGS